MVSAHDVAAYILEKLGGTNAMKLQKLLYYAQAWSLVWDEKPLFEEPIEAWAYGPVVAALYEHHRGKFEIGAWPQGDASRLNEDERDTVDAVLDFYGPKSARWLSELTHREDPWRDARMGLADGERGNRVIEHDAMAEYYASLG